MFIEGQMAARAGEGPRSPEIQGNTAIDKAPDSDRAKSGHGGQGLFAPEGPRPSHVMELTRAVKGRWEKSLGS